MACREMRPVKSHDNSVIQIGAWRVDGALDEISRGGQTIKLEPKMMQGVTTTSFQTSSSSCSTLTT